MLRTNLKEISIPEDQYDGLLDKKIPIIQIAKGVWKYIFFCEGPEQFKEENDIYVMYINRDYISGRVISSDYDGFQLLLKIFDDVWNLLNNPEAWLNDFNKSMKTKINIPEFVLDWLRVNREFKTTELTIRYNRNYADWLNGIIIISDKPEELSSIPAYMYSAFLNTMDKLIEYIRDTTHKSNYCPKSQGSFVCFDSGLINWIADLPESKFECESGKIHVRAKSIPKVLIYGIRSLNRRVYVETGYSHRDRFVEVEECSDYFNSEKFVRTPSNDTIQCFYELINKAQEAYKEYCQVSIDLEFDIPDDLPWNLSKIVSTTIKLNTDGETNYDPESGVLTIIPGKNVFRITRDNIPKDIVGIVSSVIC